MKNSLLSLLLMLCASVALAEPPADTGKVATSLVRTHVLAQISRAEGKRKMFSRAAPARTVRRVRVLDEVAQRDARGKLYVRFVVDERRSRKSEESAWRKATLTGCAYPEDGKVFLRQGDGFVPARSMLQGKGAEPTPGVCSPAPAQAVQVAAAKR